MGKKETAAIKKEKKEKNQRKKDPKIHQKEMFQQPPDGLKRRWPVLSSGLERSWGS